MHYQYFGKISHIYKMSFRYKNLLIYHFFNLAHTISILFISYFHYSLNHHYSYIIQGRGQQTLFSMPNWIETNSPKYLLSSYLQKKFAYPVVREKWLKRRVQSMKMVPSSFQTYQQKRGLTSHQIQEKWQLSLDC